MAAISVRPKIVEQEIVLNSVQGEERKENPHPTTLPKANKQIVRFVKVIYCQYSF